MTNVNTTQQYQKKGAENNLIGKLKVFRGKIKMIILMKNLSHTEASRPVHKTKRVIKLQILANLTIFY